MDIICRTCLSYHDKLEPLFSKKLVDTDYNEIPTMLFLCTGLKASEDDDLSNTICTECIDSIIAAFKYRKLVWDSNAFLLEATKALTDKTENEIEIEELRDYDGFKIELIDAEKTEPPAFDLSEHEGEPSNLEYDETETNKTKELVDETPVIDENFKSLDNYIRVDDKSTTERPYICVICNQTYEYIGPLRNHLILVHHIRVQNPFTCSICSKTFTTERYFKRHFKNAHSSDSNKRNYVCELCGRAFKYRSMLRDHINRHNGVKPHKCDICDYCSVSIADLKLHLRSHTGERPYVCHICGLGYISSSHRGSHIKEVHSDGRLQECTICGETFKKRRAYLRHKMIHDPKQHSKCEICHKEFKFRKNLKIHMRQHGEKMFKCTVCEKAFYQKQSCKSHMKNAHDAEM